MKCVTKVCSYSIFLICICITCVLLTACVHKEKYPTDENGKYVMEYNNLSDYTGYMDELSWESYWWLNWDFEHCDFDGDGKWDRVWTETEKAEDNRALGTYFKVEFGNKDIADIGPFSNVAFHMTGVDLTGDGVNELVFMCQATQSTDPYQSALAIYQKQGTQYIPMDGPLMPEQTFFDYALGYEIQVLDVEKNNVTVGVKDSDLQAHFMMDCGKMVHAEMGDISLGELYDYRMENKESLGDIAWTAIPVEYENKNALELRILIAPTFREDIRDAVVTVTYENGNWLPVDLRVEDIMPYDYWCSF